MVQILVLMAMMWFQNNRWRWAKLGLVLVVALGSGCSGRDGAAEVTPPETTDSATVAPPQEETIGNFRATVIEPPRATTLTTQQAGAQINLRSQPTTRSPIVGNGQSGNAVQLLRLAQGDDGYSWYYVQSGEMAAEGWVRGDFVDIEKATTAAVTTPTSETVAQSVVNTTATGCGSDRQEALFETKSFVVHLCATTSGLRYLSRNKSTQETFAIEDVGRNQDTYIAINGDQQYHISDTSLAIYTVSDGNYSQLKGESVLRFERFVY